MFLFPLGVIQYFEFQTKQTLSIIFFSPLYKIKCGFARLSISLQSTSEPCAWVTLMKNTAMLDTCKFPGGRGV